MNFNLSEQDQLEFSKIKITKEFKEALVNLDSQYPRLKDIKPAIKEIVLYLIITKKDVALTYLNLTKELFTRYVPTIEEFLSPEYLGDHPICEETNIRRLELVKIFQPDSAIKEIIYTGSIGTAKTSSAVIAHFYNLFRLTSMKSPQSAMGSSPNKIMKLQIIGLTLNKASDTVLSQFVGVLASCKFFQKVKNEKAFDTWSNKSITPYVVNDGSINFPNFISIAIGSNQTHAIGEDLFGVIFDEAEFRRGGDPDAAGKLYRQVTERVDSRFIGKRYILSTLISSITKDTGVITKYIKTILPDNRHKYVSNITLWDFLYSCGKLTREQLEDRFYVMKGTLTHPSKLLDNKESEDYMKEVFELPESCKIIAVPKVYYDKFHTHLEDAIRNIAGESTIGEDRPFDDLTKVEDTNLIPVFNIKAPLYSEEPLINHFPKQYLQRTPYGLVLSRYATAPRYIHCDLATSGAASICCVHKELDANRKCIVYVVDFSIKIDSPNKISYESVNNFVLDLKNKFNIPIHTLTADQYQSTSSLQFWQKMNVTFSRENVKRISVDRDLKAYSMLNVVISEDCFYIGKLGEAKEQFENIYFENGKPYSRIRKDIVDGICGAVFNAIMNAEDYPVNYYYGRNVLKSRSTTESGVDEVEVE